MGAGQYRRPGGGGRAGYQHLLHAARADLLARLGRVAEARASYRHAAAMATTAAEQRFLQRRLDDLAAGPELP